MAKGSANEAALGGLHSKVAVLFTRVLERYEARLDKLDTLTAEELEDEVMMELFEDGALPDAKMLSAITKFLKDNEIGLDTEEVAGLSAIEQNLKNRRAARPKLVDLTSLTVVAADG